LLRVVRPEHRAMAARPAAAPTAHDEHSAVGTNMLNAVAHASCPPTLHPLRCPFGPWDQEYNWHRAWERPQDEPKFMVPVALSKGLAWRLSSTPWEFEAGTGPPDVHRRSQGPVLPTGESSAREAPYAYTAPRMPFGRGRPFPPVYAPAETLKPVSDFALRPGVLKDGRVNYTREGRQLGKPASWQTSSMHMHEQVFGAKAHH